MAKRINDHISISDALQEFLQDNRLQKGLDKVHIREVWTSEMGSAIEKYTTGLKLEKEVLYVQLSSSVLREELSYGKEKIINMLNKKLGRELVKKIVLR
ncbi:MAG TPA: DUF721 domain-containing protein [Salinimicrobium sp.]|nr:DUF721 domain-containing protein [Salinimicrobium sp.]